MIWPSLSQWACPCVVFFAISYLLLQESGVAACTSKLAATEKQLGEALAAQQQAAQAQVGTELALRRSWEQLEHLVRFSSSTLCSSNLYGWCMGLSLTVLDIGVEDCGMVEGLVVVSAWA
jgi:hypothetical protein